MPETLNPTMPEYWDMAGKASGRVAIALAEIKRRLQQNLPALIDYANEELGYDTPDTEIRQPHFYSGALVGDVDGITNGILLGAANDTAFEGSGQFKNTYAISIYSIDENIETEEQYWRAWDRVELIRVALFPFLGGCIDAENRVAWRSLVPQKAGVEVDDWKTYNGMYLFYQLTCDPSQNTWT